MHTKPHTLFITIATMFLGTLGVGALSYFLASPASSLPISAIRNSLRLATAATSVQPGFSAIYNSPTGGWRWRFTKQMHDGCEQILFSNTPVVWHPDNTISINVAVYKRDQVCAKPSYRAVVTGAIHSGKDSKFTVYVDGEPITN